MTRSRPRNRVVTFAGCVLVEERDECRILHGVEDAVEVVRSAVEALRAADRSLTRSGSGGIA